MDLDNLHCAINIDLAEFTAEENIKTHERGSKWSVRALQGQQQQCKDPHWHNHFFSISQSWWIWTPCAQHCHRMQPRQALALALPSSPPIIWHVETIDKKMCNTKKVSRTTSLQCATCLFGVMTKVHWIIKTQCISHPIVMEATRKSCLCQPNDFLHSLVLLPSSRARAASIFIDHFPRPDSATFTWWWAPLEMDLSKQDKVLKNSLPIILSPSNYYYADNCNFTNNMLIIQSTPRQQRLTYCGVDDHFQSGMAEWVIWNITERKRQQLLHAMTRWLQILDLALWSYALYHALHNFNTASVLHESSLQFD